MFSFIASSLSYGVLSQWNILCIDHVVIRPIYYWFYSGYLIGIFFEINLLRYNWYEKFPYDGRSAIQKRCKFYIEIRQEKFTWFFLQQITCFKIFELYSITLHPYPDKRDHYLNLQSYNLIEILIPKVEKKLNMEIFISLIFCSSLWSSLENLQPFPESSLFFLEGIIYQSHNI